MSDGEEGIDVHGGHQVVVRKVREMVLLSAELNSVTDRGVQSMARAGCGMVLETLTLWSEKCLLGCVC